MQAKHPNQSALPRLALGSALLACLFTATSAFAQNQGISQQEVDRQLEELTKQDDAIVHKIVKSGAQKGGWPGPQEHPKFRFIRLDHGGAAWDDGMGKSGADANFLKEFTKATGFKAAAKSQSHSIALLDKYPADGFPPFVFFTGNGAIGRISQKDLKTLRQYCLKGGMLIADAGSVQFHQTFLHLMRQVFPDKKVADIADDDVIYQLPYAFPNGAPSFWHHGGRRAMGVKHEGRWCVFYHPGDFNDAWKSDGFTDVSPEMRDSATKLGINLVYYAYNQWHEATTKERVKEDKPAIIFEVPNLDQVEEALDNK